MNLKEIVKEYLKSNGYHGLDCEIFECHCDMENFMQCEEPDPSCVAYRIQ